MQCSFCRKREKAGVRKLISSASDEPRAYICSECVEVCAAIIEDDRDQRDPPPDPQAGESGDPLTTELLECVDRWIIQESLGQPAHEELARLKDAARRMFLVKR